ncbi:uncharacterized protein TRIVIDRAFT_155669 [Trichoderma virens Gv29-8]|uniref:Uncharacterized protein n=1 Tax=Hypocrea virens (strain Gv29-8 / FGSC 10586) TaxID=413071 RepID=G9N0G1_HYPVG|nr:uncharacterized protein TRIVIDRAFT_155669 [Trichoderma virens Gv29-8]EHK19843.1 hypothetical protein TRIVIDRAFT_155669 [Trichoderma virens Gv29-8]
MSTIDTEIPISSTSFFDPNFELDYGTPLSATFDSQGWTLAEPIRRARTEAQQGPEASALEFSSLCFTYTVVWKLQLRKGRMMTLTSDTVEDVNVPSGMFWSNTLKPELFDVVEEKAPDPQYKPDETRITISTSKWSQRGFQKRFSGRNIDWNLVENKLQSWSNQGNSLTKLVDFAEEGNRLKTHDDVPEPIHEIMYRHREEEETRRQLKRKAPDPLPTTMHICCPGRQDKGCADSDGNPQKVVRRAAPAGLKFPMPMDEAPKAYSDWLCSQVTNNAWQAAYRLACQITIDKGYHLERMYEAQAVDAKMLATCGVLPSIALQFVSRIKEWLDDLCSE